MRTGDYCPSDEWVVRVATVDGQEVEICTFYVQCG